MDATDQTAMAVNGALNFLNLALTAWVLGKARDTERELKKNTRVTFSAKRQVRTVKRQTDGRLSELVNLIAKAMSELTRNQRKTPRDPPTSARRKKPRPRGK